MKSLSKNQVGGESCLLETAHHMKIQYPNRNPYKNPKSKKTFLENVQNPFQRIKSEVKVACWKLHTTQKFNIRIKIQAKIQNPKNILRKYIKSLSKNQVGGESCLLETAHHTKIHFMPSTTNAAVAPVSHTQYTHVAS